MKATEDSDVDNPDPQAEPDRSNTHHQHQDIIITKALYITTHTQQGLRGKGEESMMITQTPKPSQVLSLYRAILRSARAMPTKRRTAFVVDKARQEFKSGANEKDPEKINFAYSYGELQLDTIRIQAASLSNLAKNPCYHNKDEI